MLNIVNLEEIQSLLLRVPALVRNFESRDPGFADSVKRWLTQGETILVNNRLPIAAGVATLRGTLISAERGVLPPGMVFGKRTTARRIKDAAAAEVLRRAEEVIASAISVDAARLAEGEKLIRQIVAVAHRKGLLLQVAHADARAELLRGLWNGLTRDPDVGAATTHLVGLVGAQDVLILLDRVLP
jgi:hypothetical protein